MYACGNVLSSSQESLRLREYDEEGQETEADYSVTPETELCNFDSINDLEEDDAVEVSYEIVSGVRVAKLIEKEKGSQFEDTETEDDTPYAD